MPSDHEPSPDRKRHLSDDDSNSDSGGHHSSSKRAAVSTEEEDRPRKENRRERSPIEKRSRRDRSQERGHSPDRRSDRSEDNTEENGKERNPSTPPSMSVRSIVLVKEAGIIIGKGGASVKDIRERACSRINISEQVSGVPDRVLTVSGPIDTIAKAYSLVAEKLIDDSNDSSQSSSPHGATIRLLVPHTRMGSVIGKGGSKIKEIQEASGAKLNASEEMLPNSTERTITVIGVPDAIHIAVYHIAQILQEYMDRPLPNHIPYRPQPRFPFMYGPMPGMTPPPPFYGHPGPQHGGYPPMPPMNRDMPGGPHGHSGPGSQSQQIFIPNDMVGCIIGKGGSKINEIRHMSGSHIKIAEAQGNTNERLVTITGTPESNQMALYLLYNRLESEKGRMGGW